MHNRSVLRRFFACALSIIFCALPLEPLAAQGQTTQSFSDVPPGHFAYDAVEYLKQRGMITGYADGTFRPLQRVNRAEALKVVVSPLLSDADAAKYGKSPFTDVPEGSWYLPHVEWARGKKAIQGPPDAGAFHPGRNITKAEFLKIFLTVREVNPQSFGDVKLPLSKDINDVNAWFYPYLRYAIATSLTMASSEGLYYPSREITRADLAIFLHRFFLYRAGTRIQSQLSETEKELIKTVDTLATGNVTGAEYTSARALLMMRGAREIRPEETMVKAVLKVTEGYRALVRAYKASKEKKWNDVIKLSGDAWFLGDQAKKITAGANALGSQLQQYAKSFADQARSELK